MNVQLGFPRNAVGDTPAFEYSRELKLNIHIKDIVVILRRQEVGDCHRCNRRIVDVLASELSVLTVLRDESGCSGDQATSIVLPFKSDIPLFLHVVERYL